MRDRSIADGATVYRGIKSKFLDGTPETPAENRALTYRAFLLAFPEDEGLSVSESRENAFASLKKLKGTAALKVAAVRSLCDLDGQALGLDVVP